MGDRAAGGGGPPPKGGGAAGGPAHARPTVQRRQAAAPVSSAAAAAVASREERLRTAACSMALWRRGAAQSLVEVPLTFPDGVEQYIRAFEPLLFEEAREEVRSEWGKACEARRLHKVRLGPLKSEGDNVYSVTLMLEDSSLLAQGGQGAQALPEGGVAILSLHEPAREAWKELEAQAAREEAASARASRAEEAAAREREPGEVEPFPAFPAQPSQTKPPALHVAAFILRATAGRPTQGPSRILRSNLPPVEV